MLRICLHKSSSLRRLLLAAAAASLTASGFAQDGQWNVNANGNWSDSGNWFNGDVADGANYTASFIAELTADRTITLDSSRTIGYLSFENTNAADTVRRFILSGANTLTFDAGGTSTINVADKTAATIGGGSLVLAGSGNIEKTGAGSLTLSTSNALGSGGAGLRAFTGSFAVKAGDLVIDTNSLAGTPLTLGGGNDDVTLKFTNTTPRTFNVGGITVASGGSGTTTINWGTADALTLKSSLTLAKNLTINTGSASARLILNGSVSGAGGILKTGTGALDFGDTSAKSFSGGVTVSQGTLRLYGGGAGIFSGGVTVGDAGTGSNNVNVQIGSNTQTTAVHFTNNGTGTATINNVNGQGSGTLSGTVTLDRDIEVRATASTSSTTTISGAITGTGGITVFSAGANRVILSGANTFSGGAIVSIGTLQVTATGTLGTGDVQVLDGATLTMENSLALAESSGLTLFGTDSRLNLNFNDATMTVASLTLNGTSISAGLYSAAQLDSLYGGDWFTGSTGTDAWLQVIPEPATFAALAGAALLGFAALRRRRR